MEITILDTKKDGDETVLIEYKIPMRIYLSEEGKLEEYKDTVLENLRKNSDTIFELFEYLSLAAESGNFRFSNFCKTINTLSGIGKGLQEAVEEVQIDYKRKLEALPDDQTQVPLEAKSKNSLAGNEPAGSYASSDEQYVYILANKIGGILESDKVSDGIKRAVIGVINAAVFEARERFYTDPTIVRTSFPIIMRSLDSSYQRVYINTIEHIINQDLPESVINELSQYERHFDRKNESSDVVEKLDLNNLAELLSRVMKHPKIPAHLYNVISNELTDVFVDTNSPDNLLANLKLQLEQEEKIILSSSKV